MDDFAQKPGPPTRKCPRCGKFTLSVDTEQGLLLCGSCGFKKMVPKAKA